MIECYWCGLSVSESQLGEHTEMAHDVVMPLSMANVEAIVAHRGEYDLPMEES